jgi:hypothetical protein
MNFSFMRRKSFVVQPNAERLPEYTNVRRASVELALVSSCVPFVPFCGQ